MKGTGWAGIVLREVGCFWGRSVAFMIDTGAPSDGVGWTPRTVKKFDLLDRQYYWKDKRKQVDQYEQNFHAYQRSQTTRHAIFGVLRPHSVTLIPWEDISMDVVVGLLECKGFDAVWGVVDRLSKMWHFIPCHTTIDAVGLAKLFLQKVVCLHGLPRTIVPDRGPQIASTFWGQICSQLGTDRRMSTAFHPEIDSQVERMNAGMGQYLLVSVNHQQDGSVQWASSYPRLSLLQIMGY
jgi:hypothetical protein